MKLLFIIGFASLLLLGLLGLSNSERHPHPGDSHHHPPPPPPQSSYDSSADDSAAAAGRKPVISEPRIVGGDLADPAEFPYQIFIENVWNSSEIFKCGGALYSAEYVITAAHCMYFKDTKSYAKASKVWVTVGVNDLEFKDNNSAQYKQVARVQEIIPHPDFEFRQHEGDRGTIPTYDIALLRLHTPLTLSPGVQPIALAPEDYKLYGNGTVTGWGRPDPYGKWTKQLRKVDIPLVEWQECARLFKGYATVDKDMFCTGTREGGLSPCNGDSGGPVKCSDPEGNEFLCGIASFGPNRCPNYSVYTRVSSYKSWVEQTVQARS